MSSIYNASNPLSEFMGLLALITSAGASFSVFKIIHDLFVGEHKGGLCLCFSEL